MKRTLVIAAIATVGLLNVARASDPAPAPVPQGPGTCIYNQSCPLNQQAWQASPNQPGPMGGQSRGQGWWRYQQQPQWGQCMAGYTCPRPSCIAGGPGPMRQGQGRQGQGFGRDMPRQGRGGGGRCWRGGGCWR